MGDSECTTGCRSDGATAAAWGRVRRACTLCLMASAAPAPVAQSLGVKGVRGRWEWTRFLRAPAATPRRACAVTILALGPPSSRKPPARRASSLSDVGAAHQAGSRSVPKSAA
eukprot:scaffold39914_cov62-Phaeocystis_antarctica.AAC.3